MSIVKLFSFVYLDGVDGPVLVLDIVLVIVIPHKVDLGLEEEAGARPPGHHGVPLAKLHPRAGYHLLLRCLDIHIV